MAASAKDAVDAVGIVFLADQICLPDCHKNAFGAFFDDVRGSGSFGGSAKETVRR